MQPDPLQYGRMLATMLKHYPKMFEMAKEQPGFQEIEQMVVALIGNAKSVSDAWATYADFHGLVPDWKFVFASEKGALPGLSINRTFSDGSVIRGLFSKERVFVLDSNTSKDMLAEQQATFPVDYSIALDTQALSYLAPYIEGNTKRLPKDYHEIFKFISRDDVFVDPIPYMTENLPNILVEKNKNEIRSRLNEYEMLRTIDAIHFCETNEIRSKLSQTERDNKVESIVCSMLETASTPEMLASALHGHTVLYCTLLKIATIQLRRPQKKLAADKLAEFVEFMDSRMQTMFAREAIVAANYFSRGQNDLAFFGEIQKGKPDNLIKLKNMAWDLWHIRYIEGAVTHETWISDDLRLKPQYFFPALLTCDKKFIEVIDLYPLKSYAYKKGSYHPVPFAEIDWIAKLAGSKESEMKFIEKYFSVETIKRRDKMRLQVEKNLETLRQELEAEFFEIAGNT